MKPLASLSFILCLVTVFYSCHHSGKQTLTASKTNINSIPESQTPVRENVLTEQDQKALTPDLVIRNLKEGNMHYVNNKLTLKNDTVMIHKATKGQYPEAFILSCIDSRVMVEEVFDQGIGDVFVGRVAGNFVNEDLLGSMEYGCKISGARLIVVLGHESCGAIKAAIENEKLGNITAMLAHIKPALMQANLTPGDHTIKNHDYVETVAWNNITNTIQTIKKQSPLLKEMADKGEIKIVGAYYKLETGEVEFRE